MSSHISPRGTLYDKEVRSASLKKSSNKKLKEATVTQVACLIAKAIKLRMGPPRKNQLILVINTVTSSICSKSPFQLLNAC